MSQQQVQSSRWCFTLNNYEPDLDYFNHYNEFEFIKRAIWGFERAPETNTPHIQGYVEFLRSYRLNVCRRIHDRANWSRAIANSVDNFNYCRKGGHYGTLGDWSREVNGGVQPNDHGNNRPPSVPMVISALLNPATALQTRVCKEYAERSIYYDR